ncbi:unnamed protein product [Gordionus sp. m RMFG-2023]
MLSDSPYYNLKNNIDYKYYNGRSNDDNSNSFDDKILVNEIHSKSNQKKTIPHDEVHDIIPNNVDMEITNMSEKSCIKSQSFINKYKYNRLSTNDNTPFFLKSLNSEPLYKGNDDKSLNNINNEILLNDTSSIKEDNTHYQSITEQYDFPLIISKLETDNNLRKKFFESIKQSTIISHEIKKYFNCENDNMYSPIKRYNIPMQFKNSFLFPQNQKKTSFLDIFHFDTSQHLALTSDNKAGSSATEEIKPLPYSSFKQFTLNSSGVDMESSNNLSQCNNRDLNIRDYLEDVNDSQKLPNISNDNHIQIRDEDNQSILSTNSKYSETTPSTTSSNLPSTSDSFRNSSSIIEEELNKQIAALSLNQKKIDLTLFKCQLDSRSWRGSLLPLSSMDSDHKLKLLATSVQRRYDRALSSLSRFTPQLFDELLDDDLVYLRDSTKDRKDLPIENYPNLTMEDKKRIESLLYQGSKNDIVIQAFRIDVKRSDLHTLDHINWLNDEIINFYLNMITERSEKSSNSSTDDETDKGSTTTLYPSCFNFNTFFFTQFTNKGYASVKRWTKKVDIFSKELILMPVHIGAHWCMAIIDMKMKVIIYFDSLYSDPHEYYLQMLLNYLEEESMDKRKKAFDTTNWKLINAQNVPQQNNGSDCGVFALKYAEFISRRENFTFTQASMPYFRRRMILEISNNRLSPTEII